MFCQLRQMLYFCSVKTTAKGLTTFEMGIKERFSHSTNITITGYRLPMLSCPFQCLHSLAGG